MSWAAVEGFRQWTTNRKRLLQGLIGLAVEGVAGCVPGGGLAVWSTRILGEFAKHGVERLGDTSAAVPNVKPAGQSIPAEQLDQLNGWLASLSRSYAGLLDRLDALITLPAEESDEQLSSRVREALSRHADLAREFDARAKEVRRQTLSLAHIEQRLDDLFHGQKGIALSLEEIKMLILQCAAPPREWEMPGVKAPRRIQMKGKWVDANEVWDLQGDIEIEGNEALGYMQYTLLQCASSAPESWRRRVGDSAVETVEGTLEAECLTLHGTDVDDSTLLLTSETAIIFTRGWRMFEGKTISRSGKGIIRGELQGSASIEL